MTQRQLTFSPSWKLGRRVAWFAIGASAVSFAITAAHRISGGHVRWTGWVLPPLIAANCATMFLGAMNRWPRVLRLFPFVSIAIAGTVFISETLALIHR